MTGWAVILPVKTAARGKSRLIVHGIDRVSLARAIALDTIAAAAACPAVEQVVVVTDDGGLVMEAFDIPGLRFVPEGDARGLNEAVAVGAATVDGMPRAALLGDVPALRPDDLSVALESALRVHRGVVADAEGTGSTLVTARAGVEWVSAFGEGSFAEHLGLGFVALDVPADSTLRRDVDSADQLAVAAELGLGPRTARLLGR